MNTIASENRLRTFNKLWNVPWPDRPWKLKITDKVIEDNLHIKTHNPISGAYSFRLVVNFDTDNVDVARAARDETLGVLDRFVIKSKVPKRRGWRMGCFKVGRLYRSKSTGKYVYTTEITLPPRIYYTKNEKIDGATTLDRSEWTSLVNELAANVPDLYLAKVTRVTNSAGETAKTKEFYQFF